MVAPKDIAEWMLGELKSLAIWPVSLKIFPICVVQMSIASGAPKHLSRLINPMSIRLLQLSTTPLLTRDGMTVSCLVHQRAMPTFGLFIGRYNNE